MNKAYAYHTPGPDAVQAMNKLRNLFSDLHDFIEQLPGGPGREKSLAFTSLQEAAMWANKAAVLSDPQSKQQES